MRQPIVCATMLALLLACNTTQVGTDPTSTATPTETPPATVTRLLYATKTGARVRVVAVDPEGGDAIELFTYEESAVADVASGNLLRSQTPGIALSPDGTALAYTAAAGLSVRSLASGEDQTLIEHVASGSNGDQPSTWDPELEDTYSIYRPSWSSDGQYVSFNQGRYEGNEYGFVEVRDGRYFKVKKLGVNYVDIKGDIQWASDASVYLVSRMGVEEFDAGWYISGSGGLRDVTFSALDSGRVERARLSPDGARVAYVLGADTFVQEAGTSLLPAPTGVAISRADGSRPTTLDDDGEKHDAFFAADGSAVYWIEAGDPRAALMRFEDLEPVRVAGLDQDFRWSFVAWTDLGVALAGRDIEGNRARLLVIDPEAGEVVTRHDSDTSFTTYLGFTDLPA